jgi:alpha-1,6-mannosyltransferase
MPEKPSASARLPTLGLLGLAAGLGAIFNLLGRWPKLEACVPEFITLALAAGALYLTGLYLVERFPLGRAALLIILGGAVVFRLFLLPREPALSGDVYRYQWEGRVQRLHLNPYTVFPATPGLAGLQDPAHPIKAGTTVSTLYPPLSEMVFRLGRTIPAYKRLFTALDLACIALLLLLLAARKQPPHCVLTYAWNPTIIVSFAMCGHHDSLAIATLLAANLLIIGRKPALSHIFLALSFLSKFFPVLLLPVFFREVKRRWYAYASLFGGMVILGYLPYLGAGRQLFKGLADYTAGWEGNDSLFRLIRCAQHSKGQAMLVAGVMVLALVAYALKRRMTPLGASFFIVAGLLLLSPNAFPWYFTWMIPFLCFYTNVPMLLVSITCVLGYSPVVAYAAGQPYRDSPFILALEYVPVYLWLAFEGWRALNRRASCSRQAPDE